MPFIDAMQDIFIGLAIIAAVAAVFVVAPLLIARDLTDREDD